MQEKSVGKFLLWIVFVTGASVMVLEIVALRLFAPYFGNTLYTTSSVIGVILGALAIGYYFGGYLSDKRPQYHLFFAIIALSGLTELLLHVVHKVLLPSLAYKLSLTTGSILFSLTFFLVPNILLGMLSPFVIKLRSLSAPKDQVGRNSGSVFFVSTVGSIVGSFLAGFYLIPQFGVSAIIVGTSLLLLLLGLVGYVVFLKKLSFFLISTIGLTTLLLQVDKSSFSYRENVLYAKDGLYQRLTIVEGEYEEKPAVFLWQDRNNSSAMYRNSSDLVFSYTQYAALFKELGWEPKTALVVGAGAYSVPKYLLDNFPDITVDVVDIEPDLYPLAKSYFEVTEDLRLNNVVADGRRYLSETQKKYDVIFLDAYGSLYSVPSHMVSLEFFKLMNDHLSDKGLVLANVIGNLRGRYIGSVVATWSASFPNSSFYAVEGTNFTHAQNVMFQGSKIQYSFSSYTDNLVARDLFMHERILTDDYNPVDYLIEGDLSLQ